MPTFTDAFGIRQLRRVSPHQRKGQASLPAPRFDNTDPPTSTFKSYLASFRGLRAEGGVISFSRPHRMQKRKFSGSVLRPIIHTWVQPKLLVRVTRANCTSLRLCNVKLNMDGSVEGTTDLESSLHHGRAFGETFLT